MSALAPRPKVIGSTVGAALGVILTAILTAAGVHLTPEEGTSISTVLAFVVGWLTPPGKEAT